MYILYDNSILERCSPNIKANTTTATIFGGFSKQQFRYICSQIANSIPFETLYNEYMTLMGHDKIIRAKFDQHVIMR